MDTHTHECLHCDATTKVSAPFSAKLKLPDDWFWWTRRGEGLAAAPCCPKCWTKLAPTRVLRRVGGPMGRAARGGNRG
jgi:hypothetical protein